jgi:hypothetical protein
MTKSISMHSARSGFPTRPLKATYNGTWGYHPLVISLANAAEPLYVINRSGNRPPNEHAAEALDKMIGLCRQAGFERVALRGDTDFTQTAHLDRWDEAGDITFMFGIDAMVNLKALPDNLPADTYAFLKRPARYEIKTEPQEKPERVKPQIIRERGFKAIHLLEEMVAEFEYRPLLCTKSYRLIVVRKRLGIDQGQMRLFEESRYRFFISNDRVRTADEAEVVAHGVRDLLRGSDPDALPNREEWQTIDLSTALVEPLATDPATLGGTATRLLAVLGHTSTTSGSGCPDPGWPSNKERRQVNATDNSRRGDWAPPARTMMLCNQVASRFCRPLFFMTLV